MKRKGQLDYPIITFVVILVGLLIIGIVVLKVMNEVQAPFSSSLGNITGGGGEIAQTNFNYVMNIATSFWDKVIVFAFFVSIILLFVSAFLIDVHPFWTTLYVLISFFTMLFAPNIIGAVDNLYDNPEFALEASQLTFMNSIRTYFGEILVGVMVITGIIIYGKIALFSSRGGRR